MAKQLQLRRGTTTEMSTFLGAEGEVVVDTTKDVIVVHDGVTMGGHPVATRANADGTISLIKKDGTSAGTINTAGLFNNTLTSTDINQALTAAQGKVLKDIVDTVVGVGQVYQNLMSVRSKGTVYTNSSGRGRLITVSGGISSGQNMRVTVGGVIANDVTSFGAAWINTVTFLVPNGVTYRVDNTGELVAWSEI